jgi:hypothetical protein
MNKEQAEQAIDRLAGAVADGSSVDWEREKTNSPELAPELDNLEALSLLSSTMTTTREQSPVVAPVPDRPSVKPAEATMGRGAGIPADAGGRPVLFTWGRLLIVELLGKGAFGEVYRAYDPALQIDVALKLRRVESKDDPQAIDTFLAEARRLARIRHANVVRVHGADVHDGRVGIWAELVQGETLEERLSHGPMGASEALGIGRDLCHALAAVHGAGLVHRDV